MSIWHTAEREQSRTSMRAFGGGVLAELNVATGQQVEVGQVLARALARVQTEGEDT